MAEVKTVAQIIEEVSPYYKKKKGPEATHKLVYDSSSETLEPIYFFILDLMNDFGLKPEKLVDNFSSTPGSGHFSELGQRATIMQQQASKLMGDVNMVLRSVLNIVYDLKEFKIRLQHYEGIKSKNKAEQEASNLALKQIWMDKVDIAKGNSSIKAMAFGQSGFQTLMDAFLIVKDESLKGPDGKEIDLNDRVKRILKPRIKEYNIWIAESENELRKRYQLEKNYLRSQVNSLKLYSRWVKPYLKAATDLESKDRGREAALVKTFNTIMLELTLLGKTKLDIKDEIVKGNLSAEFTKRRFAKRNIKREYYSCILVDFNFRGIPQRVSQQPHYVFGGKTEVTFSAYVLNDDELKKFEELYTKSELTDVLSLIDGASEESLGELQKEIDSFLDEKGEEKKKDNSKDNSNPFFALIGGYEGNKSESSIMDGFLSFFGFKSKEKPKKEGKKKEIIVAPENWIEKTFLRPVAAENAISKVFDLFDIYKKAHGMASFT